MSIEEVCDLTRTLSSTLSTATLRKVTTLPMGLWSAGMILSAGVFAVTLVTMVSWQWWALLMSSLAYGACKTFRDDATLKRDTLANEQTLRDVRKLLDDAQELECPLDLKKVPGVLPGSGDIMLIVNKAAYRALDLPADQADIKE